MSQAIATIIAMQDNMAVCKFSTSVIFKTCYDACVGAAMKPATSTPGGSALWGFTQSHMQRREAAN
jgi:hypothetical protein